VVRADGVVVWYNSRAAELWGRKAKPSVIGTRFGGAHTLYRADGLAMARSAILLCALVIDTGSCVPEEESSEGRPDWSRSAVSVHIDPSSEIQGMAELSASSILLLLTGRKRREAEREHLLGDAEARSGRASRGGREIGNKSLNTHNRSQASLLSADTLRVDRNVAALLVNA